MPAISIPCPTCGAALKLPDTSLLGKKAKCPKCSQRFVLALPAEEEVPLQLAEVPVLPLAPRMGTSAKWVPDDLPVFPTAPQAAPAVFDFSAGASGSATGAENASASPANAALANALPANALPANAASAKAVPRKRRRGNKTGLIAMSVLAVVVVAGVSVAFFVNKNQVAQGKPAPAVNPAWEQKKVELAASNESAESLSPTSGKDIALDYIPFTPHLICHLHPADLWAGRDRETAEFQALLGNLGLWLKEEIIFRTRFQPEEIAELTFAVNFGPRMSKPDVAAVVRLKEPQTKSNFQKQFKGQRRADPNIEIYESTELCFMLIDNQTFAVAPLAMSEDLALSRNDAALASPAMEPLLKESDRDRHVTMIFDLKLLDSHREDIFMIQMQQLADKFVLWLGSDVETVSWSMHLKPNFYMETLLHNASDSSVMKVQRHAQLQFSKLAEDMLAGVRKMKPKSIGEREIIGRFPAMLQALDVGTTAHIAPSCARLITILPAHASANLAAGALLTWNQSLLTNFNDDVKVSKSDGASVPDKIVDRLQMKVLIDFRRTPLQEAFGYIGESIKTEVTIDGDALKGAGFTQNMPQTFDLGSVTAQAALHEIILKYAKERDPLVLIVDEPGKKLLLSTKVKAEADGLKVFDTAPKK